MEPLGEANASAGDRENGFVTRGCRVGETSLAAFLDCETRPRLAWADGSATVAARGAAASITAGGDDRFRSVRERAGRLFAGHQVEDALPEAARPRLFGGFAFHAGAGGSGEGALWEGFPDAAFVLPAVQLTRTDGDTWLSVTAAGANPEPAARRRLAEWRDRIADLDPAPSAAKPTVRSRRHTPSRSDWNDQVRDALSRLESGSLRKVVLAQALTVELAERPSVPSLLEALARRYPDCWRFCFSPTREGSFFGATPEQLVSRRGRTVQTEALAGSIGRGETPEEDRRLARALRDSSKDAIEHDLVVDAVRDRLAPLSETVRTGPRTVRRLATVQHLQTPIRARLAADEHVLSLAERLHPTPAVGGLPPEVALATIRDAEAFDRGWYAAPLGWFDAAGDGTFVVAIRSALARGTDTTLFAGAGIVSDSDPDEEWTELQLKYRPILDELEGEPPDYG